VSSGSSADVLPAELFLGVEYLLGIEDFSAFLFFIFFVFFYLFYFSLSRSSFFFFSNVSPCNAVTADNRVCGPRGMNLEHRLFFWRATQKKKRREQQNVPSSTSSSHAVVGRRFSFHFLMRIHLSHVMPPPPPPSDG